MSTRYLALGALIAAMAALGVGCEKEGPAEETGAAMDNATENAADKMDNATDKMDSAVDKMEQSAQEVEEATEEAKDAMDETMTPPDAAPPAGTTTAPQ